MNANIIATSGGTIVQIPNLAAFASAAVGSAKAVTDNNTMKIRVVITIRFFLFIFFSSLILCSD